MRWKLDSNDQAQLAMFTCAVAAHRDLGDLQTAQRLVDYQRARATDEKFERAAACHNPEAAGSTPAPLPSEALLTQSFRLDEDVLDKAVVLRVVLPGSAKPRVLADFSAAPSRGLSPLKRGPPQGGSADGRTRGFVDRLVRPSVRER